MITRVRRSGNSPVESVDRTFDRMVETAVRPAEAWASCRRRPFATGVTHRGVRARRSANLLPLGDVPHRRPNHIAIAAEAPWMNAHSRM